MAITFLDEEDEIAPAAPTTGKRGITFLDEEEPPAEEVVKPEPEVLTTQGGRKITFLDGEPLTPTVGGLTVPPAPEQPKPKPIVETIGQLEGIKNAAMNAFDASRQSMAVAGGVSPEEAEEISRLEYQKEARKVAPAYSEYLEAEGFDAVKAFAKNPLEISTNIIAEGLAGSLYSLGAGLVAGGTAAGAAAVTGVGAPLAPAAFLGGQIGGTFAGSLATEYGGKVLEELQNAGMDIKDPESIQKFFGDEKLMESARSQALKRGVPVAIFDGVSAGIGGRLARLPVQALTKTPIRLAVTEGVTQAALGGGGEIAGAVVAGEEIQPKAVFAEVIGEAGPAAAKITVGRIAERLAKTPEQKQFDQNVLATQVATRASEDIAPATADAVERQVQDTLASTAETPEQKVTRLTEEAKKATGIELEEETVARFDQMARSVIVPEIKRFIPEDIRNQITFIQDRVSKNEFKISDLDETQFKNILSPESYTKIVGLYEEDPQLATQTLRNIIDENTGLPAEGGGGEEEGGVGVEPPVAATPPAEPTPEGAAAPVEPAIPEVVVEPPEGVGIAPPPPRQEFTDLINEGETSDNAYQRYQSQIDEIEDRLEAEGVDIVKLVDPTLAGARNLIGQEGYVEMPPDLVEAYARREAVGAGQLAQSVGELTEVLKNQNISEQDIKRVLDTYAIDVGKVDAFAQYKANEYTKAKVDAPPITQLERVAIALAAERGEMFDAVEDISKETLLDAGRSVKAIQDYFGVRPTEQQRNEFSRISGVEFAALPPAPEAAAVTPPAEVAQTPEVVTPASETPNLEPLRRVARAEQTEEDVSGLVGQGLVELYNGQPVITQAGLETLPETERPRLNPEARKIQIDTGSNEVVAEAIAKNLRIGVDQVGTGVRMPAGWTLDGDIYVPPTPQEVAPAPEVRESRREPAPLTQQDREYLDAVERGDLDTAQRMVDEAAKAAGVPAIGVNINDGEQSFTEQILSGDKTIETRDSENNALAGLVGQRIAIVRTGKGKAKVVGYAMVGEPIRYTSKSQFDADYNKHLVSGGKYGFKGFKIGYPMLDVERIDAYDAPPATGVIKTRPIHAYIERDNQGNVIPLSQRFQPTEEDIRYKRIEMPRPVGMETEAVTTKLESLGFGRGVIVSVVNEPDASFEGRTIIRDGKVVAIELNAAALKDDAAVERVLNHEIAESANADGALNTLVAGLTPKERKEINDAITRLGYAEKARTAEEAARAVELLAEGWRGRKWFDRAVARVEAWANKLGYKLTRRAAEYIAARNMAEVNDAFRKRTIADALANLKGARKVNFNGLSAVLIPPSEMEFAYSIAAYHGTPHEIKGRMRISRIGTGEGATAYGWGLYFAEKPEVSEQYQVGRAGTQYAFSYKGIPVYKLSEDQANVITKIVAGIDKEDVVADLEARLKREEALKPEDWESPEQRERVISYVKERIEIAKQTDVSEIKQISAGNLYGVELDVEPDELLNWDKTFNEQSEKVQNALRKIIPKDFIDNFLANPAKRESKLTGDALYAYVQEFLKGNKTERAASLRLLREGVKGVQYFDQQSRVDGEGTRNYVIFDENLITITTRNGEPVSTRESRREDAIPTFSEGSPEAATLSTMAASMAKVDGASEAKPNPENKPTYKISEIASVWMDQGGDVRQLQDMVVEYTNLTPTNAAKVANAIAKQYGLQQQIAETGAVIAEPAPEAEGAPRKSAVTRLIEQSTGVRKPIVKLQVSETAALKSQIRLKAREARETRKARKEAAKDLAKSITDYIKANPIRGPINARQSMSIAKRALKLDVNNESAVDRFEMYVDRVIENANYDRDLADARALIKRAKAYAKAKDTQGNVKRTLEAITDIAPNLLDNPFEFNLVVQRYLLGLAPVTAKQYSVMPDADVRRYLESLETQISANQDVLNRSKAQRILDKQAAYAEERGIPLDEAIAILNSEEFLNEKTIEKLEDLTKLLTSMAQESQKDVKAYDETGATPKQKELISFMRKVKTDSLDNEQKKRYIRYANNLLANGATFGMEQFQSIALGQEAAVKALKNKRLSNKLAAWISPIGGDKAIDTARRIALKTQSEADTFKNVFGREAVGIIRNLLGLNRLDNAQTESNKAKEKIANETGEYYKGIRKKYGDDATGFEAKGYAGVAGYLIQTDGIKTESESIPYRRRLMEQNIVELRKSDKQSDLQEADLKERALAQLTGTTNAEILSQLQALNPASYEQLMWWKDTMLPKWRDFLKEHDENFRNQSNNYNNPDHLTITYKFPEGQLLPNEIENVYQQDHIGMRIKQAANSIKRKDHPNLPVSPQTGVIANIDINFGYNQYNALVDQVDKAYVAPAWEQVVAFTKSPEFEQVMGGRANAVFVKKLLTDIQTTRTRQSMTDDESQLVAGGVRLARKISTQAVLGGFLQPLRQVPDQLSKLFLTTGRFDLITKNLLKINEAAPLMDKFPIGRRGDAQAGTQYASQFSELARKVEASVTDRKWAKYRELMNQVGEFWMAPLRGSDVWAAKVSWMTYYEAYLNKENVKMESWNREAELVDTDQTRKDAASYAEWAVDFYGGASDPTKMASLSKQTNNGWKEFAKLLFLPLNSFALQQKNSLISDLRDAYLRTGDRKASIAAIGGTLAGMAAFHGVRIYLIGGLIYPAGKALLMGLFGIDMDEPDEEEKQKQLEDNWRKFKASMYGNIIAGGAGEFAEKAAIDAFNKTAYLWDSNINPDEILNDKGELMTFRQYEKEVSPLYRFRSYGTSEYSFGLADVLTEQAQRSIDATQQIMTPEEMERYTGNEQAYAFFATMMQWMYFFRLSDTDVYRMADGLKRQMDKQVEEREKELQRIRSGR